MTLIETVHASVRTGSNLPAPTSNAEWQAWSEKRVPEVKQIGARTWCIPVVIPSHPMRYTFVYAISNAAGEVVLIDVGWPGDEPWEALQAGLAQAEISLDQVVGIVITHLHPDHHGLSGTVQDATDAWIAMHRLEAQEISQMNADIASLSDSGATTSQRAQTYLSFGVPEHALREIQESSSASAEGFTDLRLPSITVEDGDYLPLDGRSLRVVWTPGHTPGSISIHDEELGILFTGDHILPRITPNIGMHVGDDRDALGEYLASLERTTQYEGARVAPAHEYRFDDLLPRIRTLQAHHDERLTEIAEKLESDSARSAWDVSAQLTWGRSWDDIVGAMKIAALGETVAHLRLLAQRGEVQMTSNTDGVTRYSRVDSPPSAKNTPQSRVAS